MIDKTRLGSTTVNDLGQSGTEAKVKQDVTTSAKSDPQQAVAAKALDYVKNQSATLASAKRDYSVSNVNKDELGLTHVRMEQTYNGLKVFGGDIIVHFDKADKVSSTTGQAVEIPKSFSTYPAFSSQEAINMAKQQFGQAVTEKPTSE